jgi:hypothetical protein
MQDLAWEHAERVTENLSYLGFFFSSALHCGDLVKRYVRGFCVLSVAGMATAPDSDRPKDRGSRGLLMFGSSVKSAEDDPARVIVPRLKAAGADLAKARIGAISVREGFGPGARYYWQAKGSFLIAPSESAMPNTSRASI